MYSPALPLLIALAALATAPLRAALPDAVANNPRVWNPPEGGLLLTDLRPEKLFHFPEEKVRARAQLWNRSDAPVEITVAAWIERGLAETLGRQEQRLRLGAGEKKEALFEWDGRKLGPYGKAVVAEVLRDGKRIATGSDPFTSASNVWEVGIAGGHPVAFTADLADDPAAIERAVNKLRENYINTFEKFFWAPDDFADLTPEVEQWFSGQARYHENRDRIKALNEAGRKLGVLPTTYGKGIGSGPAARDFIRENPEMVYGFGGRMAFSPDTEDLSRWQIDTKPYWQAVAWALYNMNDPKVVQHGIDELIASTGMFGWAGVRFDGHFQARSGPQRVGDEIKPFSPDEADRQTAANQRTLKQQMLAKYPRFVFGYNFAECQLDQRFRSRLREALELADNGGHIMDEYAKQIEGGSHPYREWKSFAHLLVKQAEQVRRIGGHYFPMVHGGVTGTYQTIFAYAAGAHPNGNRAARDLNRFATRYGHFLWSPTVRNFWNPLGMVVIPPGVLWEDYVREEMIDAGRRRLIIHLINPPAQETAPETFALEAEQRRRTSRRNEITREAARAKKEPDYTELDQLPPITLLPALRTAIPVRLTRQGVGREWQLKAVTSLDSRTGRADSLPIDGSDPYFWEVTVPEVALWNLLILDLEKK